MSKLTTFLIILCAVLLGLVGCAPAPDAPEELAAAVEEAADELIPTNTPLPPAEDTEAEGETTMQMSLTSPAFNDGEGIPVEYSCDGDDISPDLDWFGIPEGTTSLAFIMDDPDAPVGTWVHWVLYNIPADMPGFQQGITGVGMDGVNSWGTTGYGGPCPPGGTHRYFIKMYALDVELELGPGANKEELLAAMDSHILGQAELMGTYTR
jgi:Raf kinase inhibitor-like YbhB/YbcL family protein